MNSKHVQTKNFTSHYILLTSIVAIISLLLSYTGHIYFLSKEVSDTINSEAVPLPTVIIDAGHGGEDGGAIGENGALEKELNLYISQALRDMLVSSGYSVIMTRDEDKLLYDTSVDYHGRKKALDLAERVRIASQYENSVFISIHMNSFPQKQYHGLQVYYSKNSPSSKSLAENVQSLVREKIQPNNDRSIKQAGSNIFVLDRISSPAILIECGFLSNPEECRNMSNEKYRQRLSLAIFSGIVKYLHSPT